MAGSVWALSRFLCENGAVAQPAGSLASRVCPVQKGLCAGCCVQKGPSIIAAGQTIHLEALENERGRNEL